MAWFGPIRRSLAVLFHRDRYDRDLAEEMQSHLEMQAEENRENGMDARAARHAAKRQFGNATLLKETSRDLWGWGPLERLGHDLRYALRVLRNNPGFALVAILSLALGIGANTAIFTVVNAVLLRALPVRDPRQLVFVNSSTDSAIKGVRVRNSNDRTDKVTGRRSYNTFPLAAIREFRAGASDALEVFGFYSLYKTGVSEGGASRPARVTLVSGNFFEGLGVSMALGRGLLDSDDQPGGSAIVITQGFWEGTLNGDASILGKVLRLNGAPMTVVGVTKAPFHGIANAGFDGPADIFATLSALETIAPDEFRAPGKPKTAPDYWWVQIMARRKPGVTVELASARLTAVFRGALAASGVPALQDAKNPRIFLTPGEKGLDDLRDTVRRPLLILLVVVGVVLLLACVNMATLQLARSAARQREMAVRLSLGASRGRIIRQLLIESLLLSSLGAATGVLFAAWGAPLIAGLLTAGPVFDAVWLDLSLDLRILGFTLLATVLTGVLFGLAPALRATRVDIAPNLKDTSRGPTRRSALGLGKLLIAGQAALSLVLLAGSGLFLRTLGNLYGLDRGFARDHLLLFRLDFGKRGFKAEWAGPIYDSILQSIAATPGVRSVAAMSHPLIGGWNNSTELSSVETGWQPLGVLMNTVNPEFFTTMRMPIVAGRAFSARDAGSARPVVILNQSAARQLCGDGPAVGRIIQRHGGGDKFFDVEVVGVARDAKFNDLRRAIEPTVFVLFENSYPFTMRAFAVRTTGDPLTMVGPVRRAISAIDPDVVMTDVKTQTRLIEESLHQERLFATLLTLFAGFALLLAAIGLHGVTAYSTARRTGEIGLRIALGAGRSQVLTLVLRQVLRPVAAGMVVGLVASWVATRWIESLLYGVRRLDVATFSGAFLILVAVAMAAAFLPAWRAARIDPMTALRAE
jgi:macrolide transport system ATP-binding/permease protein